MRRFLFLLCTTIVSLCLHAQSDEEQVLVFRHSGEVNLFYASRLDSITLSAYDADSTLHDKVVSQVFHSQDTTMVVPIAEIDSVAFGSRNAIEMRPNVKDMTAETDLPWILRFDGEAIYYRLNTPASVLPKVGQRLFYGLDGDDSEEAIFPYGLTAKATAVTTLADEIRVDIETVELNEIFSKFFYAGPIHMEKAVDMKQRRDPLHWGTEVNFTIPLSDHREVKLKGSIRWDGDAVLNPMRSNYLYADLTVSHSFSINGEIYQKGTPHHETFNGHYTTVATLYRLLNIGVAAGAFVDSEGDVGVEFGATRTLLHRVKWHRYGDDQSLVSYDVPTSQPGTNQAHAHVLLDGKLFWGPIAAVEFTLVGTIVGVRVKIKFGPELEGKLNTGVLTDLRHFSPQLYTRGTLQARNKFAVEGFLVHRRLWRKQPIEETKFAEFTMFGPERTFNLFPDYQRTRGVQAATQTRTEVTTSTKVTNEILHNVETGFELLDKNNQVLKDVFVPQHIEAEKKEVQSFKSTFELPKQTNPEANPLQVRPVFHYAGYTVSAAPVRVLHDSHIMPITSYGTNGRAAFISGASVVGTTRGGGTTFHIGNYLPVPAKEPVYELIDDGTGTYFVIPGRFIDGGSQQSLVGKWTGKMDGKNVGLTFNNNGTGTYQIDGGTKTFNYNLNNPQSGDVRLLLNDQTTLIFSVVYISDTTLILRKKGETKQYTLNKQY